MTHQPPPAPVSKSTDLLIAKSIEVTIGGVRRVCGVDLRVARGERVAIVGPSGSGKSLLLRSIVDLAPIEATVDGELKWNGSQPLCAQLRTRRVGFGRSKNEAAALRGAIGWIPQLAETSLDPLMSVRAQLDEIIRQHSSDSDSKSLPSSSHSRELSAQTLAQRVHLPQQALKQRSTELSSGMAQRVSLALAMAASPELLLADEPTASLDPSTACNVLGSLFDSIDPTQHAIVLVSHNLAQVQRYCDRILVMSQGSIVETLHPKKNKNTWTAPSHPVSTALWRAQERAVSQTEVLQSEVLQGTNKKSKPDIVIDVDNISTQPQSSDAFQLKNISLQCHRGQNLALVGRSGSGKSTLARTLIGQQELSQGCIRKHIIPPHPSRVQLCWQDPLSALNPHRTILESLNEARKLASQSRFETTTDNELAECIGQLALRAEHLHRKPAQLSGGQLLRCNLLRSFVTKPEVLILDEVNRGLDRILVWPVFDTLLRLQRESWNVTFVLITHDLALVPGFADHIAVMENGKITAYGETNTILGKNRSDVLNRIFPEDSY